MSFTVEVSWWIIPAVATFTAFFWAWTEAGVPKSEGREGSLEIIVCLLYYGLAIIVSLFGWLIWAVLS